MVKEADDKRRAKIAKIWQHTLTDHDPGETIKAEQAAISLVRAHIPTLAVGEEMYTISEDDNTILEEQSHEETMQDIQTDAKSNSPQQPVEKPVQEGCDFVLGEELGRGGMGVVYMARQNSLQRDVALKVTPAAAGKKTQQRFISEAMVTAGLDHPNIVPVHALGYDEQGKMYMAMKKVGGFSWASLLHPKTPEEQREAAKLTLLDHLKILNKVCDAVHFAHAHNVVHRDLKPANVMIGEFGEVLLMDWGIAVDISEPLAQPQKLEHKSQVSSPVGTPNYMAPEMANSDNNAIGTVTDIYLLGAILYEILTGTAPHRGSSLLDILFRAAKGEVEPPQQRAQQRKVPEELADICLRAMHSDPQKRYASVAIFKKTLEDYMTHHESLQISRRALRLLNALKQKKMGEFLISEGYLGCDEVFNSLRRSLEVWPENQRAYQGAVDVARLQAQWAAYHRDKGVIEIQIHRLQSLSPPADEIIAELKPKLEQLRNSQTRSVVGLLCALAVICAIWIGGEIWTEYNYEVEAQQQRQHEIKEWQQKLRVARHKGDLDTILEIGKKAGKVLREAGKNLDFIRKNEAETAIQIGNYRDAARILVQQTGEIAGKRYYLKKEQQPFAKLTPFLTYSLRRKASPHEVLEQLFRYAENGRESGIALAEAWQKYCVIADIGEQIAPWQSMIRAALLCLAADGHWRSGTMDLARQEQKTALAIDLPVVLWDILIKSPQPPKTPAEQYAQQSPLRISRENGQLLVSQLRESKAWIFPSENTFTKQTNFLFFPEQRRIFIGYGIFLLGLDPSTGKIVERHRAAGPILYLYRSQVNSFTLELGEENRKTSDLQFDIASRKFAKATLPMGSIIHQAQKFSEVRLAFSGRGIENVLSNQAKNDGEAEQDIDWRKILDTLPELSKHDATNEIYRFVEALATYKLEEKDKAQKIYEQFLNDADLSIYELLYIGFLLHKEEIEEWARQAHEQAKILQARNHRNPDLSISLVSSPVIYTRHYGGGLFRQGQHQKGLELFELGQQFSTFIEGDYLAYRSLAQWAEKNAPERVADYYQKARQANTNGGGILLTSATILIIADLLLPLSIVLSLVFCPVLFFYWFKYRYTRVQDLASLGYRGIIARNMAFFSRPIHRFSYSFIAYMTRGERAALLLMLLTFLSCCFVLLACIQLVSNIAVLPLDLGNGYVGNPSVVTHLLEIGDDIDVTAKNLLLAEGAYQRGEQQNARDLWNAALPHSIAQNNLGCLLYQKNRQEALDFFEKAAQSGEGIEQTIARINLQLARGQQISQSELDALPGHYRYRWQLTPQQPLVILCNFPIFRTILEVEGANLLTSAAKIFFMKDPGDVFTSSSEIPSPVFLLINTKSRTILFLLGIALFGALFVGVRPSRKNKSGFVQLCYLLCRTFGHLLPGTLFLAHNKSLRGMLLLLSSVYCYVAIHIFYYGGLLSAIAVPVMPYTSSENIHHPEQIAMGWLAIVALPLMIIVSLFFAGKNREELLS